MNTSSRFIVAVHIMTALEAKTRVCGYFGREAKVTSEQIAESVNTNPVVIRRILSQLQNAGLVISKTGRGGGTRIARPADQITLRDIHEAVEESDLFHLHYATPNPLCPIGGNIQDAVSDIFDQAGEAMLQALSTHTLADIVTDVLERSGVKERIAAGMSFEEILEDLEKQASSLLAT